MLPPYALSNSTVYDRWVWVYGIEQDLWNAAVRSLNRHQGAIRKPWLITLVDYRISSVHPRLWMLSFAYVVPVLLIHTRVSHGKNSGNAYAPADSVSNEFGSRQSCVGGFASLHIYQSGLGQKSGKRPAMVIEGLDPTNDNARSRGIRVHGAHYVSDKNAGRSDGCICCKQDTHEHLIQIAQEGSFIFTYLGDEHLAY